MKHVIIVAAHRSGARFYTIGSPKEAMTLLDELGNEDGRKKNSEIAADQPGRSGISVQPGTHATEKKHDEKETVAIRFAKEVAEKLYKLTQEDHERRFVICADPHFVGLIRKSLTSSVEKQVDSFISKDYSHAGWEDIQRAVQPTIDEIYRKEIFENA